MTELKYITFNILSDVKNYIKENNITFIISDWYFEDKQNETILDFVDLETGDVFSCLQKKINNDLILYLDVSKEIWEMLIHFTSDELKFIGSLFEGDFILDEFNDRLHLGADTSFYLAIGRNESIT